MLAAHIIKRSRDKNNKYNDFNFDIFKICNNITSNDNNIINNIINYINILNNPNIIYSLRTFYLNYPEFDYYTYRGLNLEKFNNMTEVEVILYWLNNKTSIIKDFKYQQKNILIYPHIDFNLSDGGITVQYYFASLLDKCGIKVRINASSFTNTNNIFNNFYNNEFDINDTIVLYCEGIKGNPLKAPYVVRWLLSELGKNVPYNYVDTWGKNELVYYHYTDSKFINFSKKVGSIYKSLFITYINPSIKNNNSNNRNDYCHTFRKSSYYKTINKIHPNNSFEITRDHTQNDYIEIFNKSKYFVCYDPLTFLCIIAPLCGCISIVHPFDGISKKEWLQTTGLNEYLKYKNDYNLYGVAYGNSQDEIDYAYNSLHLVTNQWDDIKSYEINYITKFITDINQFELMQNTIKKNYYE